LIKQLTIVLHLHSFILAKLKDMRTILIHSLHKKMLDPNSANPEEEPLAHGCVFPRTS
jgi:hypothetical protein